MKLMSKMTDYRKNIADTFLKCLEEDPNNWKKPWQTSLAGRPVNAVTGRPYHGVNMLYLNYVQQVRGYNDNRWATFKQIKDKGWHLEKGSKGIDVEYWMPVKRDPESGKSEIISWKEYNELTSEEKEHCDVVPRYFKVFNASCIEGVPEISREEKSDIQPDEVISRIANGMNITISNDGLDGSYYMPGNDTIHLPAASAFATDYDYNAVALHELGHATGHESRLNRDMSGTFGSSAYAREELVAELTSCFMSEYIDAPMTEEHMTNHKAYLQGWAHDIKEDNNVLFSAIKDAQEAADYMEKAAGLNMEIHADKDVPTGMAVTVDRSADVNVRKYVNEVENGMIYFCTKHSILLEDFPMKEGIQITNFDGEVFCMDIHQNAWGYIVCPEELTPEEMKEYDFTPGGRGGEVIVNDFDGGRKIAVINNQKENEQVFTEEEQDAPAVKKQKEADEGFEL